MKTIYIIIIIAAIIAILITFAVVFYRYFTEKINNILSSLNGAIQECNSKYKTKHELLLKMIEIIETKYKVESKVFEDVKSIKEEDLIKKEKTMNKCYKEILQIKEDNKKPRELKAFTTSIKNYEDNELHIISLRTFYNKYTLEYNNILKKFPCNIISKINKYSIKTLLEGKEIDSSFNNNLEV